MSTLATAMVCLVSVVPHHYLVGSGEKGPVATVSSKDVALNRSEWQRRLYKS